MTPPAAVYGPLDDVTVFFPTSQSQPPVPAAHVAVSKSPPLGAGCMRKFAMSVQVTAGLGLHASGTKSFAVKSDCDFCVIVVASIVEMPFALMTTFDSL